ncbi:MAG TPA: double-cubane-cluster-containing anaerobic reductase [Clostridia bacterium]|nr:double-cubane-cluster-containing anaerobic reductase [Clostridia bacterium]
MNRLPEKFEEYSEARRNSFVTVKRLKDEGKTIVGTFCAFTPSEIMMAAGAVPVSLCGFSEEPIADAERDLPRNICPLIKSSYGFAITDKCPYFYFSDIIVGETTCDGKKKMYELLADLKKVHIMQLPQTSSGEDSYRLWENELNRLRKVMEAYCGTEITEEKLREAIRLKNMERSAIRKFYELGKLDPPPCTGYEIHKVLSGAGFKFDKQALIESLEALRTDILRRYPPGKGAVSKSAKRILITGCPLGEATEKIIKSIEENGGVVVCYENCGGAKSMGELVDEEKEPIAALTEKYLNIACSCMTPNNGRLKLLDDLCREYRVDGVVDVILQACHTYSIETNRLKKHFAASDIPYMSIETDYSQNDSGQLDTRLAAFIEML